MTSSQHNERGLDAPRWDETLPAVLAAKQHLRELEATLPENDTSDAAILKAVRDLIEPLNHLIQHVPAPTSGAVSTKLDFHLEFSELAESDLDPADWIKAIAADARRLAGGTPAEMPISQRPVWDRALATYDAAQKADKEYYDAAWNPAYEVTTAGGPKIPADIEAHMQHLMDLVKSAEAVLMPIPAEMAEQVLTKLLISFGPDRECDGWIDMILDEAERFTGRTAQ